MILVHVFCDSSTFNVTADPINLQYNIVPEMEVLGGVLNPASPCEALLEHRLRKADKCYVKHARHFRSKWPIGLKFAAFVGMPILSATFMLPVLP